MAIAEPNPAGDIIKRLWEARAYHAQDPEGSNFPQLLRDSFVSGNNECAVVAAAFLLMEKVIPELVDQARQLFLTNLNEPASFGPLASLIILESIQYLPKIDREHPNVRFFRDRLGAKKFGGPIGTFVDHLNSHYK